MAHRTQITLTDEQYDRLRAESQRTGLGLAELVRRALDRTYRSADLDEVVLALDESFGVCGLDEEDGAGYVERLRGGMARRLGH